MERPLRWKTLFLLALTILSVVYLLPSLNVQLPSPLDKVFSNKIQLGLDLQGGLHIVYGVALDKVVDDKAGEVRRDLEDHLAKDKIEATVETPRTPLGSVNVILKNAADVAKIDDKFIAELGEILGKVDCPADKAQAVCLRVKSEYAEAIQDSALEQAITTIRGRLGELAEATVVRKGYSIIVELPGLKQADIDRLKGLIGRTAQLEFKIVANDNPWTQKVYQHIKTDPEAARLGIEAEIDSWSSEKGGQFKDYYLTAKDETLSLSEADAVTRGCAYEGNKQPDGTYSCLRTGREVIEDYMKTLPAELAIEQDLQLGFEKIRPQKTDIVASKEISWRTYTLYRTAELTGTAVSEADVAWDQTTNRPHVQVKFNRQGGRRFGDLTSKNVGKRMAIILDDEVNSAPTINDAITGGVCTISMGGSDPNVIHKESQDLVNVLRTGSLSAPLRQESESQVGATLGQDSIDRAQVSMAVGAAIVVLIMLYFYRFSGLLANLAMILNVLFQVAILATFQATLTLPGIAGLVLTIGMAVDSNIIIYERIREELTAGKTVRGAVDAGFGRAFWTVFDAHVTNFVAGFVLLEYGTGPIRGFAVMLLIGVVVNLFTATWVSRLFFDHWLSRRSSTAPLSI